MKLSHAQKAVALLAFLVATTMMSGCGLVNSLRAKNALNEGARAYKSGDFQEAEQHFRHALELSPDTKNAQFFVARAIHAQYRPGVEAEPNVAKARQAIAAYQQVLDKDPTSDEAYNAMVYLYRQIKDEPKEREFLIARATGANSPPEKRSQALTVLASKEWNCSYQITEQKEVKTNVKEGDKTFIRFKKPAKEEDFQQAKKCVTEGLKLAEQAISLDANSEQAWSFKTNLLLEAVKIDEMENNNDAKAEHQKQVEAAQKRTMELSEINRKKREAEEEKAKAEKDAS